jgi:tRNA 2-selenouridine synthase
MGRGRHVLIEDTLARRAERLVADYTATADFEASVEPILERLGTYHSHQMRKELRALFDAGDHLALAAFLMEEHYDPLYKKSERTYTYDATLLHEETGIAADRLQALFPGQKENPRG